MAYSLSTVLFEQLNSRMLAGSVAFSSGAIEMYMVSRRLDHGFGPTLFGSIALGSLHAAAGMVLFSALPIGYKWMVPALFLPGIVVNLRHRGELYMKVFHPELL